MQHTTLNTAAIQPPLPNQRYIPIGKQWVSLINNNAIQKCDHLSPLAFNSLSARLESAAPSLRLGATISRGIQHKAEPHHAWNVTQLQVKAEPFVPLNCSALHGSPFWTVDTRTEVLAAMIQ